MNSERPLRRDGAFFLFILVLWAFMLWITNAASCDIRSIEEVPDDDDEEIVMAETTEEITAKIEAHADKQAAELKPESELHMKGIILRLYRMEALLDRASKYVPKYDDDGHLLPLKQAINLELGTMDRGEG